MKKTSWAGILILLVLALVLLAWAAKDPANAAANNSCIECHSGLDSPPGEPVKLWQDSIHNDVGITCDGCHGGDANDGARAWIAHKSSPETAKKMGFWGKPSDDEIVDFCGKCHVDIKDNYVESPHAEMGEPNCVTCHTSHSVQRASLEEISGEVCAMCHDENPKADLIANMVMKTRERLDKISHLVEQYHSYLVSKVEENLNKAILENIALGSTFHRFSVPPVRAKVENISGIIDEVGEEIDKVKAELKKRKKIGLGIIIFALVMAALLYYYSKIVPIPSS